jgi:hypothetical protein
MREATARIHALHAALAARDWEQVKTRIDGGTLSALREAAEQLEQPPRTPPENHDPMAPHSICCNDSVGYIGDEVLEEGFSKAFMSGMSYFCNGCGKPCHVYHYGRPTS